MDVQEFYLAEPPPGQAGFDDLLSVEALSQAGSNPIRMVYEWLKTLPEFESAADV